MVLISTNHYNNNGIIEKFISIDIYSNYVFLLLVASPVTSASQRVKEVNIQSIAHDFRSHRNCYAILLHFAVSICLNRIRIWSIEP